MVAREAVIVTERREGAPTRRLLYEPIREYHYLRREQVWRESIEGWHDVGCEEVVVDVEVSR
jgi:hypothetical protein